MSASDPISFKCTHSEETLIAAIVKRAIKAKLISRKASICLTMDITATNANGTALDLAKLLDADSANFAHDVLGIYCHIDRKTGKLVKFFLPRCTRLESEVGA